MAQLSLKPRDSRLAFATIVGEPALHGHPLSAGPLLEAMDGFTGSVIQNVMATSMVNVAVEHLDIKRRVFHGDLVRFEGQLVHTGRTSATVQISGYRSGVTNPEFEHVLDCFMTMVAVDNNGRPAATGVPKLVDTEETEFISRMEAWTQERKAHAARWRKEQAEVDALESVSRDMLEISDEAADDRSARTVDETQVDFCMIFLPKQLNASGTVFGGELLHWMDKVAVACAQRFVRNENVVAVAVNHVAFFLPVTMDDVVTQSARLTRVSGSRMEVAVDVFRKPGRSNVAKKCLTGFFTLANLDSANNEVGIQQHLRATEDDQFGLRAMLKAQRRAKLAKEETKLFALEPLEISPNLKSPRANSKL